MSHTCTKAHYVFLLALCNMQFSFACVKKIVFVLFNIVFFCFFFVKTSLCKMTVLLYLPAASSLQQGLITS